MPWPHPLINPKIKWLSILNQKYKKKFVASSYTSKIKDKIFMFPILLPSINNSPKNNKLV